MNKELKVDNTMCIGCGQCVAMFPENFNFDPETGLSTAISNQNLVDDMVDICPVSAISIVESELVAKATEQDSKVIEFPGVNKPNEEDSKVVEFPGASKPNEDDKAA